MKKTLLVISCFALNLLCAHSQDSLEQSVLNRFGFREFSIPSENDTIFFYATAKGYRKPQHLVLFLSGSTPDPIFTYTLKNDRLESYFWGHQDYKLLPEDYLFVVIAKKGLHGVRNENTLRAGKAPEAYLEHNSLDYRVWQADNVIDYCFKNLLEKPDKIIVYGHSEGFNVAAKLLIVNRKITHSGLWAGSAMPDYYDFMLSTWTGHWDNPQADSSSVSETGALLAEYAAMFEAPGDTRSASVYTNKRWTSYAEPGLNHLLQTDVPIFMVAASMDENVPVEGSLIVPLEFIRTSKTNLLYRICAGCDHGFSTTGKNGQSTSHWDAIFREFISWTNTTQKTTKQQNAGSIIINRGR